MTEAGLYPFLSQFKLGVLSTIAESGTPQSALVGIAITRDLELVFDTVKTTRKYPNLNARLHCSFVIGWAAEQTVQYEGEAEELKGADAERYREIYFEEWPECRAHLIWPGVVHFVVRPKWIRYGDFAQNPPLIREFTLGAR